MTQFMDWYYHWYYWNYYVTKIKYTCVYTDLPQSKERDITRRILNCCPYILRV